MAPRVDRARKHSTTPRRPRRRPTSAPISTLAIRTATDNPMRGHRRVKGEPTRLGHKISASTLRGVLRDAGIDPAPRRSGPTRRRFPTAQAHGIPAVDFIHGATVPLKHIHVLILIEHGSRRVHPPGISAHPDGSWTTQAGATC